MAKEDKNLNLNNDSDKLAELEKQANEYLGCWQRAVADYQNFKKETEKNQAEFAKFANMAIIAELLPVMNNFKAAFNCIPENQKETDWVKGIGCIKKQLEDLLKSLEIEEVKTTGEKFNPEYHEAIGQEPGEEEDMIVKEVQPGYVWHGKVIAPAKVIVSTNK